MPRYIQYDTKWIIEPIKGTNLIRGRTYTFERFHCPVDKDTVTIYPTEPPETPLGYSEWEYYTIPDWTPVEARRSGINRPRRLPQPEQRIFLLDL